MIVESDYRGYRIEVAAFKTEGAWDADVTIRQTLSATTACAGHVTCRRLTAHAAEESGAMCARQWVDRHGRS